MRDDLGDISKLTAVQEEKRLQESSKLSIYCTVSLPEQMYLSSTEEGHVFLWNPDLLTTNDAIELRKFDSSPLHDGSVNYIIIHENFMITFGSDGQFKFWEYMNVLQQLYSECSSESEEELENSNLSLANIEDEKMLRVNKKLDFLSLQTIHEFTVSKDSDLVFAVLHSFENDQIIFFMQDRQGILWQVQVTSGFSKVVCTRLLSGLGCGLTDLTMCPLYPLIAATSNTGCIIVYDCVAQEILRQFLHSTPASCLIWPDAQFDSVGASLIVGFQDGTLRTFSIVKGTENLVLQYAIKSHTSSVQNLSINASCTVLVTQGLDSKLFFYSVGGLAYIPVGFYINNHEIECLEWLTYNPGSKENEESILLICKYSYIVEVRIPRLYEFQEKISFQQTYFIESSQAQVHKLNGLRKYHELGDRIYDSDCEEKPYLNEAGKQVLVKLKYAAKKEARENLEKELGFFGRLSPPKILCCLMSAYSDHIWLSLGKEDFGYLFEFVFTGKLSEEPLEMIPVNALEVLTAERINILCLNYRLTML
ncbi:WD repeat-containing protein 52, partial [Stegodyphus mimosarum]